VRLTASVLGPSGPTPAVRVRHLEAITGRSMLDYTSAIRHLMGDVVRRVGALSVVDLDRVLVFARRGRTGAAGAYATCHSLNLPTSEPGYYFWRDRDTGRLTRRSPWFVMKTPRVVVGGTPVDYMISFSLPRFCDQTLEGARKRQHYPGYAAWVAKLDTIIHELYHIDPADAGIRRLARADGGAHRSCHSPEFYRQVAQFVREYFASGPDPAVYDFLRHDFAELRRRHGGLVGLTFRNYPSYPQRYLEALASQPPAIDTARLVPLEAPRQPLCYTDDDLGLREFHAHGCTRVEVPGRDRAA